MSYLIYQEYKSHLNSVVGQIIYNRWPTSIVCSVNDLSGNIVYADEVGVLVGTSGAIDFNLCETHTIHFIVDKFKESIEMSLVSVNEKMHYYCFKPQSESAELKWSNFFDIIKERGLL